MNHSAANWPWAERLQIVVTAELFSMAAEVLWMVALS
jgi:hypothetical protein